MTRTRKAAAAGLAACVLATTASIGRMTAPAARVEPETWAVEGHKLSVRPEEDPHGIKRGSWRSGIDPALGWLPSGYTSGDCKAAYYGPPGEELCRVPTDGLNRDHFVAWAEALDSGAAHWPRADQLDFYNSVKNLYILGRRANIIKSDHDPVMFKPPDDADWCRYAREWVAVKAEWRLSVDPAERDALAGMLGTC